MRGDKEEEVVLNRLKDGYGLSFIKVKKSSKPETVVMSTRRQNFHRYLHTFAYRVDTIVILK